MNEWVRWLGGLTRFFGAPVCGYLGVAWLELAWWAIPQRFHGPGIYLSVSNGLGNDWEGSAEVVGSSKG